MQVSGNKFVSVRMQEHKIVCLCPHLNCLTLVLQTDFQEELDGQRSTAKPRSDEPHVGKYRLIKTIGKGNFAKVKLAKHVPTGQEVG